MSEDARSCPSCGAHVAPHASVCSLCGTPVDDDPVPPSDAEKAEPVADGPEETTAAPDEMKEGEGTAEESSEEHVYCTECGSQNPPGANYCSQCGTELQDVSSETPSNTRAVTADLPKGERSDAEDAAEDDPGDEQTEMGQQILLVVGTAILLVLGLFFLTQWSQQYEWGGDQSSSGGGATAEQQSQDASRSDPSAAAGSATGAGDARSSSPTATKGAEDLSMLVEQLGGAVQGPVADRIDSLQAELEGSEGSRRRQLQAQLAKMYVGAGAPGRAALVQSRLADESGRIEDRRRAADLLYKWIRQVERQKGREEVTSVAQHVAEAYAAVVEERPQDLDARTRMGEAYLLTSNPMKGIRAINQVLEDDSTFVPARFQKGLALLQINRLDQAITQFEKVMAHASQDDPFYQQAKRAIEVIRKKAASSGNQASGTSGT